MNPDSGIQQPATFTSRLQNPEASPSEARWDFDVGASSVRHDHIHIFRRVCILLRVMETVLSLFCLLTAWVSARGKSLYVTRSVGFQGCVVVQPTRSPRNWTPMRGLVDAMTELEKVALSMSRKSWQTKVLKWWGNIYMVQPGEERVRAHIARHESECRQHSPPGSLESSVIVTLSLEVKCW